MGPEEDAMAEAATRPEQVRLAQVGEGVALVTVSGPPPCAATFSLVEALAARLVEAREGGARVTVVASDVPGHWIGHASLRDLLAMFRWSTWCGPRRSWSRRPSDRTSRGSSSTGFSSSWAAAEACGEAEKSGIVACNLPLSASHRGGQPGRARQPNGSRQPRRIGHRARNDRRALHRR
jgi:hypothetical protein